MTVSAVIIGIIAGVLTAFCSQFSFDKLINNRNDRIRYLIWGTDSSGGCGPEAGTGSDLRPRPGRCPTIDLPHLVIGSENPLFPSLRTDRHYTFAMSFPKRQSQCTHANGY